MSVYDDPFSMDDPRTSYSNEKKENRFDKTIAKIPRGKEELLIMELDEFKGHQFVRVKILKKDMSLGKWSIAKDKGVTFKLKELEEVKKAIEKAINETTAF